MQNVYQFQQDINMLSYSVVFIKNIVFYKIFIKPPPLMFPWQIYNFFKAAQASTEVFREKGVLKNFAIFTGKHLCWSLNLIKLRPSGSCLRDCNFVKKRLQHRCFSVNIATFLWNIYSEEHLRKEFC